MQKKKDPNLIKNNKNITYNSFACMFRRCHDKTHKSYKNYGGKGITICKRWRDPKKGFEYFVKDLGPRPSKEYTLERQNKHKGYSPKNCRWATREEQDRNRTDNFYIEFAGENLCIIDWCKKLNFPTGGTGSLKVKLLPIIEQLINTEILINNIEVQINLLKCQNNLK